jgi:hypothetical protein
VLVSYQTTPDQEDREEDEHYDRDPDQRAVTEEVKGGAEARRVLCW